VGKSKDKYLLVTLPKKPTCMTRVERYAPPQLHIEASNQLYYHNSSKFCMCIILPLAACIVLVVICSCEWPRTEYELSAEESNYGVGRCTWCNWGKENFKDQISN